MRRSLAAGAGLVAPAILRSQQRPAITHGIASGDVSGSQATIWSRADRPARMFVEYATTEGFASRQRVAGPDALDVTDFTARVVLTDLPPGQRISYRVTFQDLSDLRVWSDPVAGVFRTPAAAAPAARPVTIAWSADTAGQGWGINPEWGGYRIYQAMQAAEPDLFVHCGDTIYADQPLLPEVALDDGSVWKNVVTPAKSKVAESLEEFRGNYQYNLLDEHMRRFNAAVPQMAIWDDHEVRDNWYDSRDLSRDDRYREKRMALLAARARRAFLDYHPVAIDPHQRDRIHRTRSLGPLAEVFALDMRSFRGPNSANLQPALDDEAVLLGREQLAWLKARLAASRATWKVIASDLPVGVVVRDGPQHFEAVANSDAGPPLGRELEIADLLRFIKTERVHNVVWITGDVHYCAAHHYDPARARFTDFDPFWEFVAGPLNSGTFGPNEMDATFGPEVRFTGVPPGMKPNRPPSAGLQFFGTLRIEPRTRTMTVTLRDLAGAPLHRVEIEAR